MGIKWCGVIYLLSTYCKYIARNLLLFEFWSHWQWKITTVNPNYQNVKGKCKWLWYFFMRWHHHGNCLYNGHLLMWLQIHNIRFYQVCCEHLQTNVQLVILQECFLEWVFFFQNHAWKLGLWLIHECGLYTSLNGNRNLI